MRVVGGDHRGQPPGSARACARTRATHVHYARYGAQLHVNAARVDARGHRAHEDENAVLGRLPGRENDEDGEEERADRVDAEPVAEAILVEPAVLE